MAAASLFEAVLATALFALISFGVIRVSIRELERAEVNAVALQLSGWLEAIQRAATRIPAPGSEPQMAGCSVEFTPANSPAIATVSPASCSPETTFSLPLYRRGAPKVATRLVGSVTNLTFTTRGTVVTDNQQDLTLVIQPAGNSNTARCLRVNRISGTIELGFTTTAQAANCDESSYSDLL